MKLSLRLKVLTVSFLVIVLCFAAADRYLTRKVDAELTSRVRADLATRLALMDDEVAAHGAPLDDIGGVGRARRRARRQGARPDHDHPPRRRGPRRLGPRRCPRTLGREPRRPGGDRRSRRAGQRHEHAPQRHVEPAHDLRGGAAPAPGVIVRVAAPLSEVDGALDRFHLLMALAAALSIITAIGVASLSVSWVTRVLRSFTEAARRMAAGDLGARMRIADADEATELWRGLDKLARNLESAVHELRAERDLLRGILDGMQEGVLLLDRDARILRVNPALRAMLLMRPDAVGAKLLEVVRHAELMDVVGRAWTEGHASGEIELSGLKPRRLLVRVAPLPGDEDALLAVFADVTDARRLETMRRDFVANVSHELRTPVTSVRSAAETLREGAANDPVASARFVDIIARNAERLQRLIEDLLDLSRIESKELKMTPEHVELATFLPHVMSLFRERADRQRVKLVVDVPRELRVWADRRALEQVITNLVDNAVKYCPGAEVKVRAARQNGRVEIAVVDTGPGIDGKHLPRIFERFYRVDAGRSRELGGTGLGLSIVKHLSEGMGGSITVESTLGRGTSFSLGLPSDTQPRAGLTEEAAANP